jgi:hypothetical protein
MYLGDNYNAIILAWGNSLVVNYQTASETTKMDCAGGKCNMGS